MALETALDKYRKDVKARMSVLSMKNDILVRSLTACSDCTKEIYEIERTMSALDRKDETNQTALKALEDTGVRLREEYTELRHISEFVYEDYMNEEKKFKAFRVKGPDKPPNFEPSSENGSVEGDTLC